MVAPDNKKSRTYKCVFCESHERLTREHIWANWLRPYLPRTGEHNYHWTTRNGGEIKKGKIHRPGDAHSQRLQVVCGRCNSGWMSTLQEEAKPILVPLVNGERPILDEHSQYILSRWATMNTMVIEFADPPTAMIPQEHRSRIQMGGGPLQDWHIWIGRHNVGAHHPAYFNHFGWAGYRADQTRPGQLEPHKCQTTTFTVGQLLFHTFMVTPSLPEPSIDHETFAQAFGLRTIWPSSGLIIHQPERVHDWESRDDVSEYIARASGLPAFRSGPPL